MNHPILAKRARLWGYLLLWVPIAGLIAAPALLQGCSRSEAAGLAIPLAVLGAGMGLAPFYLAKAINPERESMERLFGIWGLAAALDSAFWVGGGWLLSKTMVGLPGLEHLPLRMEKAMPVTCVFWVTL